MHPWHDTYVDDTLIASEFPVVIEIPKGSKNKYELDKETGLLRLDRVLHSAVYYPADYGFIPRTFCDDGDPLDALVLGQEPVYPLTIVEARAIGVMRMRDDKGIDDKIVAISVRDPAFSDYTDKASCPPTSCGRSGGSSRTTRRSSTSRSSWRICSVPPKRFRSSATRSICTGNCVAASWESRNAKASAERPRQREGFRPPLIRMRPCARNGHGRGRGATGSCGFG